MRGLLPGRRGGPTCGRTAGAAHAQLAISANDAKVKLTTARSEVKDAPPDTLTFIDLRTMPPRVLAEIEVPNSVVGPPTNVAITPKEEIALVASAMGSTPPTPASRRPTTG